MQMLLEITFWGELCILTEAASVTEALLTTKEVINCHETKLQFRSSNFEITFSKLHFRSRNFEVTISQLITPQQEKWRIK